MISEKDSAGIIKAIDLYAELGRTAKREYGEKAFTKGATMSWVENGEITTVPITTLFDGIEQTGEEEVSYTVSNMIVENDIAYVHIESTFSKIASFHDMFTLAKQGDEWKIVSKIYTVKK